MEFVLEGENFLGLPQDVKFVISNDNDDPLMFRYNTDDTHAGHIVERTNNRMVMSNLVTFGYGSVYYLGAILSEDGEIVYWVNDTKPLP